MNRRGFLGTMLAACAAPAIVRADSLMRIVPVDTYLVDPYEEIDLSEYALQQAIIDIANFVDKRGIRIAVLPTKIITTRELYRKLNIPRLHSQLIALHPQGLVGGMGEAVNTSHKAPCEAYEGPVVY